MQGYAAEALAMCLVRGRGAGYVSRTRQRCRHVSCLVVMILGIGQIPTVKLLSARQRG